MGRERSTSLVAKDGSGQETGMGGVLEFRVVLHTICALLKVAINAEELPHYSKRIRLARILGRGSIRIIRASARTIAA